MKLAVFLVLACAVVIAAFVVQPIEYLSAAFVIDDGLYYLEVPRNVVAGNGVTYDNRTYTNGFHPLWGAVAVLMAAVTHGDTDALLRAAFLVQGLFVLIGLAYLGRMTADLGYSNLGVAVAMLLLFFARLDLWLSTMESATLMLALVLLIAVALRRNLLRSTKTSANVLLGALLAVVFLARLDTIFVVMAFLIVQTVNGCRTADRLRKVLPVLKTGAVFTLISAPYLIINKVYFGSIIPVSGIKKMERTPYLADNLQTLWTNMAGTVANKLGVPTFVVPAGVVIVAVVFVWLCLRYKERPAVAAVIKNGVVAAFVLGVVLRGAYLLTFVKEYTYVKWYWVPEYVLTALTVGFAVTLLVRFTGMRLMERPALLFSSVAVLFVAGCVYLVKDAAAYQQTNRIGHHTALWVRDNVPSDKLFAMHDSGIFAYFSERDVIPLNGLITDRDTMEMLRRGRYREVIDKFNVDFVVRLLNADLEIPREIILYQSKTLPRGGYAGKRISILKYSEYPSKTAVFFPHD